MQPVRYFYVVGSDNWGNRLVIRSHQAPLKPVVATCRAGTVIVHLHSDFSLTENEKLTYMADAILKTLRARGVYHVEDD